MSGGARACRAAGVASARSAAAVSSSGAAAASLRLRSVAAASAAAVAPAPVSSSRAAAAASASLSASLSASSSSSSASAAAAALLARRALSSSSSSSSSSSPSVAQQAAAVDGAAAPPAGGNTGDPSGEAVLDAVLDMGLPMEGETPLSETIPDHLAPAGFMRLLEAHGLNFFCGVPDSLLKDFAGYVADHVPKSQHVITANEGNAIAVAAGFHCATQEIACVYMQNSGIGNAVNPLLSLASPRVYAVPMLLLVGWRGEPGKRDEPQHQLQGEVLPGFLKSMGIKFAVLPDYGAGVAVAIAEAVTYMRQHNAPFVFLVRKNTFTQYKLAGGKDATHDLPLTREGAISTILDKMKPTDATVATTGFTSRELYEQRLAKHMPTGRDFLMVGSMGHATAFALGVALFKQERNIYCIDGDGAMLMHMGTMGTIGEYGDSIPNLKHILVNNGAHDSVGGQPTAGLNLDMEQLANGFAYKGYKLATNDEELKEGMDWLAETPGPILLEVRCRTGARKDLGRPKTTPIANKAAYIRFLEEDASHLEQPAE